MIKLSSRYLLLFIFLPLLSSCFTDAATRLAYDLEAGVSHLGNENGSTYTIRHQTPSQANECTGPYKLQFDKVGAIIIWCYDASGNTVSSHSTSYHARFVVTLQTYLIDKGAGEPLLIDIERRSENIIVTNIY